MKDSMRSSIAPGVDVQGHGVPFVPKLRSLLIVMQAQLFPASDGSFRFSRNWGTAGTTEDEANELITFVKSFRDDVLR